MCGAERDLDSLVLDAPLLVVEVVAPSSESDDTGATVAEYFSVATITNYLIIDPHRPAVIHHQRQPAGELRTAIHGIGTIHIELPG